MTATIQTVDTPLIDRLTLSDLPEEAGIPDRYKAFWFGVSSAIEPDKEKYDTNRIPLWVPLSVRNAILSEYTYYNLGWAVGISLISRYVQVIFTAIVSLFVAKTRGLI